MDMVHGRQKKEQEDRFSKLPNDIIHRILGFLDMKYAIQTSKLSRKWRFIWTSMPHLNFDSHTFGSLPLFAKFVKLALSHRNNGTDVSSVKLTFTGDATPFSAKSFVNYAYSHNVQQLMIVWSTLKCPELPQHFFSCHTLKHLTIRSYQACSLSGFLVYVPKTGWDFPALETLNLSGLWFDEGEDLDKDKSLDIFSKCVNLKDLTLHCCSMSSELNFKVCAPQLLNLTFTGNGNECYPKVFNVVAPKLENFTASIVSRFGILQLSTEGLDFLEKVNLSSSPFSLFNNKSSLAALLDLFQKLHSAKILILGGWIIQALTLFLDQVSHESCPFNNLKCLKVDMAPLSSYTDHIDHIAKKGPQLRKYLLENSPHAIFIMDLPQVPPMRVKRPMQTVHNYTMSNKMPKLDFPTAPKPSSTDASHQISRQYVDNDVKKMANLVAKIHVQDQLIAEQKAMFEAKIHMQDKVIAKRMKKVQMQDEVIAKQKAMFEAKIQMQDEVIANQKAMFEAKIQVQDQLIVEQKAMFEAEIHMRDKVVAYQTKKVQMQDEVIANQKATFEAKIQMQNEFFANQKAKIQMQEEVIAKHKTMFEAMVEAAKLQHEKLMSLIIKTKIAELRLKIESEKPDDEVIRSMGINIKSLMDLIPESVKIKLEARFSAMYEGFKSLFLTHFDDSQWERIKSELEKEYKGLLA